ncbi:MAG TPA: GNAT family N-acetyltransferase [Gaiellaceae bacterium]|jgi:GNAT superfamily N-acetyltransferase
MPSAIEVLALEQVAYDVWRAPEAEELDGWRLRFAHGLTGRANSVWPNGYGVLPLAEKIARVEAWYAHRGLPARFQLTDAARPVQLAGALEARGYRQPAPSVSVETAALPATPTGGADVREELDDEWLALWAGSRRFDDLGVARALLLGSPGHTAFARIGEVAIGRGVAVDGWLGVTSMVTVPEARRRGHAREILGVLVAWGRDRGCTRAVLQVESTNAPARALYAGFGFRPSHEYRYVVAR